MLKKEPQKPQEHTSEHVKSQNFLGAHPPHTIYRLAPLLVFALGPHDPLSGYDVSHNTLGEEECLVPTASMS